MRLLSCARALIEHRLWAWRIFMPIYLTTLGWLLRDLKMHWTTDEFVKVLILAVGLGLCSMVVRRGLKPVARMLIKKKDKWSPEVWEVRISSMTGNSFKLAYHLVLSIVAYRLTVDESWLPWQLFGKGVLHHSELFAGTGTSVVGKPVSEGMVYFYQVAFAYHMQELAYLLVFEVQKPSFYEMFLHHATTIWLVSWSNAIGYRRVGILVLIVHYVSDVPGYVCKVFVDTKLKIVTITGYVCLLFTWAYLRLYVLPFVILRETSNPVLAGAEGYNTTFYLLGLLVLMHAYWFALFLQMGYILATTGETKDSQASLPETNGSTNGSKNGSTNGSVDDKKKM